MLGLIRSAFCCFVLLLHHASPALADEFPFRVQYPEIAVIDLPDLKTGFDRNEFLIIDLRSKTEFDTIHIKDALNLPYSNARFPEELQKTARSNPTKKIVVYDNGTPCLKSYKAAEDAIYQMIPNVYAFDAGIMVWANTYPAQTMLLGKKLNDPQKELISAKQIKQKEIDFETFRKTAEGENVVVIDARDPLQRKQELPGIKKDLHIPLDKLVHNIILKGHMKDKQLYIFDQVGRQVVWLMYYLEDNNYTNYHFLEGGAQAVLVDHKDPRVTQTR